MQNPLAKRKRDKKITHSEDKYNKILEKFNLLVASMGKELAPHISKSYYYEKIAEEFYMNPKYVAGVIRKTIRKQAQDKKNRRAQGL